MTQDAWKRMSEWPLSIAAVVFLIAYAWSVIADVHEGMLYDVLETVMWIVWGLFVIDYVMNLSLARPRWRWFYRHIPELLVVVLPFLRPLRLLRLVALVSVLQRTAGTALRGRVMLYVACSASIVILVGGLAVLDAEQNVPTANIHNFWDALWWAFVTITTVGYGDYTPVTHTGRLIALGLMISGIALLGVVTASLASWFVERAQSAEAKEQQITRSQISALTEQVMALREELAAFEHARESR
ncbi:ion channel [Herbiconiux sp. 11R-BC]|uniref:potassium channel family protein n=1 Tax=Herbiconiux sp. 11R-BC TaxID=3111637 RepID=UPI003C074A24